MTIRSRRHVKAFSPAATASSAPLTLVNALDQGERAAASIVDYLLEGEVHIKTERRFQQFIARNQLMADGCLEKIPLFKKPATVPEADFSVRGHHVPGGRPRTHQSRRL